MSEKISEKISLFIVDDSSIVRDLLTKSLKLEGSCEVIGTAIHGKDALDKLSTLQPDVIITDMDMPVMNGLEFIRALMVTKPTPTIVLSSWTQNDKSITLEAMEVGAVDFIPKPSALNPQGFQETLKQLIFKIRAAAQIPVARLKTQQSNSAKAQAKPQSRW